jgi:hypothetical protein
VGGSPSRAVPSELLAQIKSLQQVIDSQFLKLQDLQKEKAKLKTYIVKYEAELRSWEQKPKSDAAAASAGSPSVLHYSVSNASVATSFVVENA